MDKLLTDHEVAGILRMNVRTLRRKIKKNKISLHYIAIGRQMLFRPQTVEAYISALEVLRDGSGYVPGLARLEKRKKVGDVR